MKGIKPDDYYNDGYFELARLGKVIYAQNNMSDKQHHDLMTKLGERYDELKAEIDSRVSNIREKVLNSNPLQLLQCASDMFKLQCMNLIKDEEIEEASSECLKINKPYLATEYIQSIYVSSPITTISFEDEDNSDQYITIISEIEELMDLINSFYLCWGTKIKDSYPQFDEDISKLLIEEQMLFSVRGNRYPVYEKEYYENLLLPHNDVFIEVFGISANLIIEGITKIQYALSQQKLDVLHKFHMLFDKFRSEDADIDTFHSYNKDELERLTSMLFGSKLHDVHEITNWPEIFINELSWGQNECASFWNGEFGGWPIKDSPICQRPFIKIDGKSYCFDYYSFVDNFYRSIQKAVTRNKNDYKWSNVQQEASEKMVATIFESILPGCKTYLSNYYPIKQSTKQMAENDLLVTYDDTLIIVEVKAGSFVYTSPITDFESHIKSYKKLIEEADHQCQRTKDYLDKNSVCKIYNQNKSEKALLYMSDFPTVYMMSVTVDNINAFAAKVNKLKFLNLQSKAISIAIDDLMVYRDYFDSPLIFLHFLKQRSLATQNPLLALNDEFDHLGMYIHHNCYNYETLGIKKETTIHFVGYREELNAYFDAMIHPELKPKKPEQKLPALFVEILNYLTINHVPGRCTIANYLLDFSSDTKEDLCEKIGYILVRQVESRTTIPLTFSGNKDSLRFTVFVNQPPYERKYQDQLDYALATLSWNKESDRVLLSLSFVDGQFEKILVTFLNVDDITNENRERIFQLGKQNAKKRMQEYKRTNPGKIGPNKPCPCGSGKKYKKCCGFYHNI